MNSDALPELTFPEVEASHLREWYRKSRVILEYGSGGSTIMGASMPGKLVISVESDREWAISLQRKIDLCNLASPAIVWHSDIGPTGKWGRPQDNAHWPLFYQYPIRIWAQPFFRNPDTVLIDGRFRAASFVATYLRIQKRTVILFDDYTNRAAYQVVERLAQPDSIVGRMAVFQIEPGLRPPWIHDFYLELLGQATFASQTHFPYRP